MEEFLNSLLFWKITAIIAFFLLVIVYIYVHWKYSELQAKYNESIDNLKNEEEKFQQGFRPLITQLIFLINTLYDYMNTKSIGHKLGFNSALNKLPDEIRDKVVAKELK